MVWSRMGARGEIAGAGMVPVGWELILSLGHRYGSIKQKCRVSRPVLRPGLGTPIYSWSYI